MIQIGHVGCESDELGFQSKTFLSSHCTSSQKYAKTKKLKQSELKSSPQNQYGNYLKLQIVKIQKEDMVNRVSSYFQKGGH